MQMKLNVERMRGTKLLVTHHGLGPTCIQLPYVFTRIGNDNLSTPFLTYNTYYECFGEDGEVREFGLFEFRKRYESRTYVGDDHVLCYLRGAVRVC